MINNISNDKVNELLIKVFQDIGEALKHIHKFNIIHRDIKPENILWDAVNQCFVLADFGIAHFNKDEFPKEAEETTKNDRLANFSFHAPEQIPPVAEGKIKFSTDIYQFSQVLHYIYFKEIYRDISFKHLDYGSNATLKLISHFIQSGLIKDCDKRLQNITDIQKIKELITTSKQDPLTSSYQLDEVIVHSFPLINTSHIEEDPHKIKRFINNFNKMCDATDFWLTYSNSGDIPLNHPITPWNENFIIGGHEEYHIQSVFVYRHSTRLYKSFFIFFTSPLPPYFEENISFPRDAFWFPDENRYIPYELAPNGMYEMDDGTVMNNGDLKFHQLSRPEDSKALMICVQGNGAQSASIELISNILKDFLNKYNEINQTDEKKRYFDELSNDLFKIVDPHHSSNLCLRD